MVLAACRLAWPAVARRESLVATARHIERRFPELGERLSIAVAFSNAEPCDPPAGSRELRQAAIAEAQRAAEGLDFRAALDVRPLGQALALAGAATALAALFVVLNPAAFALAARRLALPWRDLSWPRRHELAFVTAPQRLASGDTFEVVLIDRRGRLPDRVEMQIHRQTAEGPRLERQPLQDAGGKMVFRLDNVQRSFAYRARGGDDDSMPWTVVSVVAPPRVIDLAVQVTPPAYSGLAEQATGRVVRALRGSRLKVQARLDKPIRDVAVKAEGAGVPLPAVEVAADGQTFTAGASAPWILEGSGAVTFVLIDLHGLKFDRDTRLELVAVPDAPPVIAWELPSDDALVTSSAAVPIQALVKDDLAVRSVQLRYARRTTAGDVSDEQVYEISPAPTQPSAPSPADLVDQAADSAAALAANDTRQVKHRWELSAIAGLRPGDVVSLRLTADDFLPQEATTAPRRLTIITQEELASRVASRQAAILGQIAEALRLAVQCRDETRALLSRLPASGALSPEDVGQLEAIRHSQQQVARLLSDRPDGAAGQTAALLDELINNRALDQPIFHRLTQLRDGLLRLNAIPLPAAEQELLEAVKLARAADEPAAGCGVDEAASGVAQRLMLASQRQQEIAAALEQLVGNLAHWDSSQRLERELMQIEDQQVRLLRETDELRLRTTTGLEATAAERAAARELAQRELELGRRFDKLQARLEGHVSQRPADGPATAADARRAVQAARRLAIGGQMRQAASQLGQLQLNQSIELQQAALKALGELRGVLSPPQERAAADAPGQPPGPTAADVLLVKTQQEAINRRTAELERRRREHGTLTPDEEKEFDLLAKEQRRLADIVLGWIKRPLDEPRRGEEKQP
jgi:hypothetical protein